MIRMNRLAAGFLGVGFGWVSYVMLFVEPGMGFATPADFFDAEKVAAGYASPVWVVSSIVYLLFPIALAVIARSSDDRILRWAALASGLLFLVVGAIDQIGVQLPTLVSTSEEVVGAVAAVLPVRFALLRCAIVTLGVLAWRTTRQDGSQRVSRRIWRGFGWVVLGSSVAFMFVFIPVPLVFLSWGAVLAVFGNRMSPVPARETVVKGYG